MATSQIPKELTATLLAQEASLAAGRRRMKFSSYVILAAQSHGDDHFLGSPKQAAAQIASKTGGK